MQTDSLKAVVAAMIANFGLAIAKFAGFMVTGATSMLAESVHSVADTANQGLLLWGARAAQKAPTPLHPFGHGRERYFWSFVVSLVIFLLGGAYAIYEGLHKLQHPEPLGDPTWALVILGVGVGLESWSFRTAFIGVQREKGTASLWKYLQRARTPELPVVLLEDFGALVGLAIALIGISLAALTGNPAFDAGATLAIGILLTLIAMILAVEMKSLLIGESATPADLDAITSAISHDPDVVSIIHIRTQHLGPEELLVAAKLEFRPEMDLPELARAIDRVETAMRAAFDGQQVIYLEPDLRRQVGSKVDSVPVN